MHVLVLPVSGGGFVSQLAILQHLCETEYLPDMTLSSSGGNVAAYVAAAADWKWPGIERIARSLTRDLFARPWDDILLISAIIGFFKGNLYDKGRGAHDFLADHFTSESITKYEIWTGIYNRDRQMSRLICNRDKEHSIIDISLIDKNLDRAMDPIFAAGNLPLIADGIIASASIPAIVPAQKIEDGYYVDGGVFGASPLTVMHGPILKYTKKLGLDLHLTYINSVDLSKPNVHQGSNVFDTWRQATSDLVRSSTVIDRRSGYDLLRFHSGHLNQDDFSCNYQNLERVKVIRSHIRYSMLEIYPLGDFDIDITNFTEEDIISSLHRAYGACSCRFWWLSNEGDKVEEIRLIIKACQTI